MTADRDTGPSLNARLAFLVVCAAVLALANLRWAVGDADADTILAYVGFGALLLVLAVGAHLVAVRNPERPVIEGASWVLTLVLAVVAAGAVFGATGG